MGKEAEVRAVFADGEDFGRLQYEAPRLVFRGAGRRAQLPLAKPQNTSRIMPRSLSVRVSPTR